MQEATPTATKAKIVLDRRRNLQYIENGNFYGDELMSDRIELQLLVILKAFERPNSRIKEIPRMCAVLKPGIYIT